MRRAARVMIPITLAVGLAGAPQVRAERLPEPGQLDPHIQTVGYDTTDVVVLQVAQGFAVTLEFSPDERIENVVVGNSASWQVTPNRRADHLFVKPLRGSTETNLTVISDQRRYAFMLRPLPVLQRDMPYIVRFIYPAAVADAGMPRATAPMGYTFRGAGPLRPVEMSDDGRITSIVWGPDVTMPAVYSVGPDGKEAIVNGVVRDGAYVVEGVAQSFVFRRGRDRATAARLAPPAVRQ